MKRNHLRRSPLQSPINSPEFIRTFVFDRAPTTSDYRSFKVSDLWIHRNPGGDPEYGYYVLVNTPNKSAFWIHIGARKEGSIHEITGDSGNAVVPDSSSNVNLVSGSDGVSFHGDSNTLTLTVKGAQGDIETLTGNVGDPVNANSSGNIDIVGIDGVSVSGSDNTLTISVEGGQGDVESLTPDEGDPVVADDDGNINILGGSGVTTVGTLNTLTINRSISDIPWTEVNTETQIMENNNGYIANNSNLVTLTLPSSSSMGDIIKIDGKGSGGWLIAQNAGQTIHFLNYDTSIGIGGSLASTNRYANVTFRCIEENSDWTVESVIGNLEVT